MGSKKLPFADEDGNTLPELDPMSGMAQIIVLLEYGRKRGFRIGPTVQVGDTIVQVQDLRQAVGGNEKSSEPMSDDMREVLGVEKD